MRRLALMALMIGMPSSTLAQEEIVVTAQRRGGSGGPSGLAATAGVGVRHRADFAVQTVTVYGDARDKEVRRKEILDTVRVTITLGSKRGIQLAYGEGVIRPLTLANYAEQLKLENDDERDDAQRVRFIIKTPLTDGNALAAIDRLAAFIKAVPAVGRAVVEQDGEAGVSIVDPTQYRPQILAAIAADANAVARQFGSDYGVQVDNLAQPVRWVLASPTEVLLYIDHTLRVMPKRAASE